MLHIELNSLSMNLKIVRREKLFAFNELHDSILNVILGFFYKILLIIHSIFIMPTNRHFLLFLMILFMVVYFDQKMMFSLLSNNNFIYTFIIIIMTDEKTFFTFHFLSKFFSFVERSERCDVEDYFCWLQFFITLPYRHNRIARKNMCFFSTQWKSLKKRRNHKDLFLNIWRDEDDRWRAKENENENESHMKSVQKLFNNVLWLLN